MRDSRETDHIGVFPDQVQTLDYKVTRKTCVSQGMSHGNETGCVHYVIVAFDERAWRLIGWL